MKTKMTPWTQLAVCSLASIAAVACAQAAVIESVRGGGITDPANWEGEVLPGTGDNAVVKHALSLSAATTFDAALSVTNSGNIVSNRDLTMNDNLSLDGGKMSMRVDTLDMSGNDMILNGGSLQPENASASSFLIINANLTGSGSIDILNTGTRVDGTLNLASSVTTTGFTGMFNLTDGTDFTIGKAVVKADASFGLTIVDTGSVYNNTVNMAFTSLTIAGNDIDAGDNYSWSYFDGLGLGAYIANNGGFITVVPEPGTYALIGGLLALSSVMIRRRRS
jgi:hypothetical protein